MLSELKPVLLNSHRVLLPSNFELVLQHHFQKLHSSHLSCYVHWPNECPLLMQVCTKWQTCYGCISVWTTHWLATIRSKSSSLHPIHVLGYKSPWWWSCLSYQVRFILLLFHLCSNLNYDSIGHKFPSTISSKMKHIYCQMLLVFTHIDHAHYCNILHLHSEPHFNSLFAHFLAFGQEYKLLEVKGIKGRLNTSVGIGNLWERWKEICIIEG